MGMMRAQEEACSSISATSCFYDVFLSFRGEDTRKTFTDHLYTALVQAGIQTFRDDDEIDRGENLKPELERAIRQSRASVIVFSKDYASSTWCLDELMLILECRRTARLVVLPVFYDVDPSDVRKQKKSVGESFTKYEEQIEAEVDPKRKVEWLEKVKAWRAALTTAAELTGMVLKNQADGHESRFIQEIVGFINRKLDRMNVLKVPQNLVGIDSRIASINLWLQDGLSDVDQYVICGMGGVGKTTIARCAYNCNFREFDSSSFLENVREKSRTIEGKLTLQNQLLSDILNGRKQDITNLSKGTSKIEKAMQNKRVLLVLDDVDDVNHLDELLGTQKFYRGSKIIITARVKLLPKTRGVFKEYMVETLNESESLELLSWHAFKSVTPLNDYGEQSQKVVQLCGGLPLALKVLGSSLFGSSTEVWNDTLKLLGNNGNVGIENILRISYESLEYRQDKSLFLHIACFFVGEDRDYIVKILECDFSMIAGIQHLVNRCLLTVSEDNKLMMHQLLQNLGREIVYQESPKDPGARSRLWHHDEAFKVLKGKKGTGKVEGLTLDMHNVKVDKSVRKRRYGDILSRLFTSTYKSDFEIDAFEGMSNLRLLQLNYVRLLGNYSNFPGNLIWLRWHGFFLKCIPIDIPLEELVTLDMRHSKLEQVWKGLKHVTSLKILNLSHSRELAKAPNFKGVPNLEELILKGCANLVELCPSIEHLKGLTLLDLEDCKNLMKLPTNIGTLTSLEKLVISGCSKLVELPMGLRKLESLKVLLADRVVINQEPHEMGQMEWWRQHGIVSKWVSRPRNGPEVLLSSLPRCLRILSLAHCNIYDESFPKDFSNIAMSLEYLNLSGNPICRLPDWVKSLSKLKELKLLSCKKLEPLLALPYTLLFADLGDTSVEKVTSSSAFDLVDIWFYGNSKLVEIEGYLKIAPIGEVDDRIITNLGWRLCDVESLRNVEVRLEDNNIFRVRKKSSIQGLHEWGIFSTYVPLEKVPSWFSSRQPISHAGSSIPRGTSVTITVPHNVRVQCLNVCSVYEFSGSVDLPRTKFPSFIKISNKTKDLAWIYCPFCVGLPEGNGDQLAWLSQWKFGNQLEAGDELTVMVDMANDMQLKDYDIQLEYGGEEEDDDSQNKSTATSWNQVIGGDLSPFQLSTGDYFFHRGRTLPYPLFKLRALPQDQFRNIFGDLALYKELENWGWSGAGSGAAEHIYVEST